MKEGTEQPALGRYRNAIDTWTEMNISRQISDLDRVELISYTLLPIASLASVHLPSATPTRACPAHSRERSLPLAVVLAG